MDDIFLQKVLSGQTEEFRYFVRTYKDFAYNLALSVVKNEVEAEDIVQEAFVRAFNSLASFNRKSKFSSWFYRIVINCAYKHLQKKNLHRGEEIPVTQVSIEDLDSLMGFYEEEEKKYCIRKALDLLNSDESLVLQLHYLLGNKLTEIMEITGWSESKTKVCLHRARKSMKVVLEKVFIQEKITR